jgi:hypothetical protein
MLYIPWNSNTCFHVLKFAFQVVFSAFPGKAILVFMNEIVLNFRVREVTQILPPYTNFKDPSHVEVNFEAISAGMWRYHFLQNRGDEPLSRQ